MTDPTPLSLTSQAPKTRRLSHTRSPPRQRRSSLPVIRLSNKNVLDEDLSESKEDPPNGNVDGFIEKELQARLTFDMPAYHKQREPNKPAMKDPKKNKKAKRKIRRKSVSFSSEMGVIPGRAELPPEEEEEKEEEEEEEGVGVVEVEENLGESYSSAISKDSKESELSQDPSESSMGTDITPTRREKLTPAERKARREAALKEAKAAAKNIKQQNNQGKQKGLFGKIKRMTKSFDSAFTRSSSSRSLQAKMETLEIQGEQEASTNTSAAATTAKFRRSSTTEIHQAKKGAAKMKQQQPQPPQQSTASGRSTGPTKQSDNTSSTAVEC